MLSFWEKDFDSSIEKHINFLNKNLENQDIYSSKFSEILESMDVFNSDNEKNKEDDGKENDQENKSENNDNNKSDNQEEESKKDEAESSLDAGFDISDQKMNEQLEDSESSKESV